MTKIKILYITSLLFFVALFWVPPIKLKQQFVAPKHLKSLTLQESSDSLKIELIKLEHSKLTDEIQKNRDFIDNMFYSKFILIGGLLAGIYIYLFKEDKNKETGKYKKYHQIKNNESSHIQLLLDLLRKPSIIVILSLSLVICLSIDTQIRIKYSGSKLVGLYIENYIEAIYNPIDKTKIIVTKTDNDIVKKDNNFYGWEQFLRIQQSRNRLFSSQRSTGLHKSMLVSFTKWLPVHIITYLIYAMLLWSMILNKKLNNTKKEKHIAHEYKIHLNCRQFGYIIISVATFLFTLQIHSMPSILEYDIKNFDFFFGNRNTIIFSFMLGSLLLIVINFLILYLTPKKHIL